MRGSFWNQSSGKKLFDFTDTKVDQWKRSPTGTGHFGVKVESEALENAGDNFTWVGGTVGRNRTDRITCTDRSSALDAAACERA